MMLAGLEVWAIPYMRTHRIVIHPIKPLVASNVLTVLLQGLPLLNRGLVIYLARYLAGNLSRRLRDGSL